MTIGQRIRNHRRERALTQKQLGELVGVNQITVALWETDKHGFNSDYVPALCRALRITPNVLFDFE